MANDHDKFTCNCDNCNAAYARYHFVKNDDYYDKLDRSERRTENSVSIADYTTEQLEAELKGRRFAAKLKRVQELRNEADELEKEIEQSK